MIRGDFTECTGLFAGKRVSDIRFNKGNNGLNMSLKTLTHPRVHTQCHSFTPDMSSLCFSTEDIHIEPDRTLRTVAPAGTAPASSTGTRMDASSCEFMHIYCLF